jgi:hypothetical protein
MNKLIATTAAGLALATGSVAVAAFTPLGSAFAQDGTTPSTQTQNPSQDGQHQSRVARRHHVAKAAIKDAAGVIGIAPKDLAAALKSGQSVADVATAHGVNPQTVIDKLVADASARLDKAVTEGKLTQERADKAKAALPDRVTKLVNKHFDGSKKPAGTNG